MHERACANAAPMTQGLAWATHERKRQQRRPRALLARASSALAWGLFGLVAVALYTNVISDDAELRARTEAIARTYANCGDQCRVSKMQVQRTVVGYSAEFDIDGVGPVQVVCRRDVIVAGEQRCLAK